MKQNFIEDNIIILSKQTMDIMLKSKNPSDVIGMYCFYYYAAKWQKTNVIKCTTSYVMQGLNWSKEKTISTKKTLKRIGLIEDKTTKNEKGQLVGWFIKLNYVWKKETIKNQRVAEPEGGFTQRVAEPDTNALSVNTLNALNANKEIAEQTPPPQIVNKYRNLKREKSSKYKSHPNSVVVGNMESHPNSVCELHKQVVELFDYFSSQFLEVVSDDKVIFKWDKNERNAKPYLKSFGLDKMKRLVDKYFQQRDKFYEKVGWSLDVFLTASTINALLNGK